MCSGSNDDWEFVGEINFCDWRFNLKDFGDVDDIWSNRDVLLSNFDDNKSFSSSHIWLNNSDKTGNIRWQRLQVRNWSISFDKLPLKQK
jgi:hypothetical protein